MLYVTIIMSVDATITSCQPRTVKSVDYVDLEINAMSLIFFVGMEKSRATWIGRSDNNIDVLHLLRLRILPHGARARYRRHYQGGVEPLTCRTTTPMVEGGQDQGLPTE